MTPDPFRPTTAHSGSEGIRTLYLSRARGALSQMSYRPMAEVDGIEPPRPGFGGPPVTMTLTPMALRTGVEPVDN